MYLVRPERVPMRPLTSTILTQF